jgi:flagellar biosynthesis/type III secretory pathway chaperone
MNSTSCREQLIELLEAHNARISRATEYLASIKQAIAENRLDNLQDSLSNPDFAVDDIERLEQQRYQLLADYGFSQDSDGFEKCMTWCDDEQNRISGLYQQLIQSLVQLQHAIQINSLLVSKGRERVKRSLGILTGLGAAGNYKTYSSDGKPLSNPGRRDIAIA